MKKILILFLLIVSPLARAEWVVLSCVDIKDQRTVVVEFDESKGLVRYQNDDKRVFKATISEYKIKWVDSQYNTPFYLDRLSGRMESYTLRMDLLGAYVCSSQKKKF